MDVTDCDEDSDASVLAASVLVLLKPPELSLGIKMEKISSVPKNLNYCVIKHEL